MTIPTEPIGSIPRSPELIAAHRAVQERRMSAADFAAVAERALRETIREFEATGSPVITDGEQTKPSFATYPLDGVSNISPDGT